MIEKDSRQTSSTFQSRYPLRSLDIERRVWVFRRISGLTSGQSPVVMLPGIRGGVDIFFEVALSLGELMPVITINPPAIEDVARIRARPAGLLGRLGIRRTNLLGASLGGYLARNFVLLHSDNVAQLVIANGFIDVVAFTITLPPASTGAAMDAAGIVQQTLRALFFVPTRSEGDVRLKRAVKALFGLAQILENYKSHVLLIMVGSHQRISNPG